MNRLFSTFLGALLFISFHGRAQLSQSREQAPKDEVNAVLNKFHLSFGKKDTAILRTLVTESGIFCGTYPDEFSPDRDFVLNYCMTAYFADTATVYSVTQREIMISEDNKSAIAMELFIYPPRSNRFDTRCNTHLIKKGAVWLIDSFSFSLVIPDEDMGKINKLFK